MTDPVAHAEAFRRSARIKALPVVAAVVVVASVAVPSVAVLASLAGVYFLVSAVASFGFRLEITPERLRMHGYFGGATEIGKATVNACRYHAFRAKGRSVELFFLEILGLPGGAMRVWRYGWGSQRSRLFPALADWLAEAGVALGDPERAFLDNARR